MSSLISHGTQAGGINKFSMGMYMLLEIATTSYNLMSATLLIYIIELITN